MVIDPVKKRQSTQSGIEIIPGDLDISISSKFRIKSLIREDCDSVLYQAQRKMDGRTVALRVFGPDYHISSNKVIGLRHPNIVRNLSSISLSNGAPCIVMDVPEGRPLSAMLAPRRTISAQQAVSIITQILSPIGYAHRLGMAIGNLTPCKIYIVNEPNRLLAKLVGLGINNKRGVGGNLPYCSPEQLMSTGELGQDADIWAIGVILFESVFGRLPFDGVTPDHIVKNILKGAPVFPEELPLEKQGIKEIVLRALSKDKRQRYQTAAQLLRDLIRIRSGPNRPLTVLSSDVDKAKPGQSALAAKEFQKTSAKKHKGFISTRSPKERTATPDVGLETKHPQKQADNICFFASTRKRTSQIAEQRTESSVTYLPDNMTPRPEVHRGKPTRQERPGESQISKMHIGKSTSQPPPLPVSRDARDTGNYQILAFVEGNSKILSRKGAANGSDKLTDHPRSLRPVNMGKSNLDISVPESEFIDTIPDNSGTGHKIQARNDSFLTTIPEMVDDMDFADAGDRPSFQSRNKDVKRSHPFSLGISWLLSQMAELGRSPWRDEEETKDETSDRVVEKPKDHHPARIRPSIAICAGLAISLITGGLGFFLGHSHKGDLSASSANGQVEAMFFGESPREVAQNTERAPNDEQSVILSLAGILPKLAVTVDGKSTVNHVPKIPIAVSRSDEPVTIRISAEGYKSIRRSVVPSEDRTINVSLKKTRRYPPSTKRRSKSQKRQRRFSWLR